MFSSKQMISTPVAAQLKFPKLAELTVSEISVDSTRNDSTTETAVSGKEEMEFNSFQDNPTTSLNISITNDIENEEDDHHDEDYVPEFALTLRGEQNADTEDVPGGDLVLGNETDEDDDENLDSFTGPGITQILTMEESASVLETGKVIAFQDQLVLLAKTKM